MKGYLTSSKTFRYFTHGDPVKARTLIYVLHGYGQLAEFFIRKFQFLSEDYYVVAPEGMHRFYLEGSSRRVGASWMTKEERTCDISDNLQFLERLHEFIISNNNFDRTIILGFSQGGATAARWYYNGQLQSDHLIIWASVFPPDLNIDEEISQTSAGSNAFFIGDQDEYYSTEQQLEQLRTYHSKGFESIHYQGKHDVAPDILGNYLKKIKGEKNRS